MTIRVVLADDQRVVREGLAMLLSLLPDIELVAAVEDGQAALEAAGDGTPDVVLMDLRMPRMDGVEATRHIRSRHPHVRVVVLTTYADTESVVAALHAGASGYLTKDASAEGIHQALVAAAAGHMVLDAAAQAEVLRSLAGRSGTDPTGPTTDSWAGLTPRESEIVQLVAGGLSNREIAARLVLTEATVKTHLNHVLAKTGARDRAQLVALAYRNGLTSP